jgi:hypothetical protein
MSDRGALSEVRAGPHLMRFEQPDVCHILVEGNLDAADARVLFAEINQFLHRKRWLLLIVNMRSAGILSVEARQAALELSPGVQGAAIVGAGGRMAVVLTLLNKAFNMVHRRRGHSQRIGFMDTEVQARAWVNERRRALEFEEAAAAA